MPGVLPGIYEPRSPAGTVLNQVVRTHLERFLAETAAATDGAGVPRFIEREFRDFLGCGALGRGFARVRCDTCRFERLVPFSCKARAVCPSCGGRRMAEQAAHLVEAVLPSVPVRQWVLTVSHRLRYRLAFDHALCRAVLGVFIRAVLGWYHRRGRRAGVPEGQSGTVTVVQRFGSGLPAARAPPPASASPAVQPIPAASCSASRRRCPDGRARAALASEGEAGARASGYAATIMPPGTVMGPPDPRADPRRPRGRGVSGCAGRLGDLRSWRSGASGRRNSGTRARPPQRPSGVRLVEAERTAGGRGADVAG